MARRLKKTYFINGKSYSITDLLGFQGVCDAVSSRTTEGSKREFLRSMLRSNRILPSMLTGSALPFGNYGSQRRRANEPLRDTGRVTIQGPRLLHDENYDGPYDPRVRQWVVSGVRRRVGMFFNGTRRSAKEALRLFPKLSNRLDGGKGLKQRTLEAKIRREYKKGIPESDLRTYETRFDQNRDVGNQIVRHLWTTRISL